MNDVQEEIVDDREERAKKAKEEFAQILAKYNCYPEVSLIISSSNQIKGVVNILAK